VISFTPPPLYPRSPFYRRLGGPQSRSGRYGEVKIFAPTATWTPAPLVVQPVASRYTDWAIPIGIHGNVFRNQLLSKNQSLQKRVNSFPSNGSTCHNIAILCVYSLLHLLSTCYTLICSSDLNLGPKWTLPFRFSKTLNRFLMCPTTIFTELIALIILEGNRLWSSSQRNFLQPRLTLVLLDPNNLKALFSKSNSLRFVFFYAFTRESQ
jgi:hypothetical protein